MTAGSTGRSGDVDVARLASQGRPGAPPLDPPADGPAALALVERAAAARLTGPLLAAVEAGTIDLPAEAVDRLVDHQRRAQLWCLHLETRLLEVHERFGRQGGVAHLVVKGPAIAHLDEATPELRSFADIDLLVAAADLDRAVAVLVDLGATRPWPELRPGYDRRFAKSVTLTLPDGVEVDLHRTLADGVHGQRIPLEDLFARQVPLVLGGVALAAPSPRHRLLHAAYHAVLGSPTPRPMSLRDLAGYLARPDLAPAQVGPEVARWRGEAVLATAVRHVLADLEVDVPAWSDWAAAVEVDPAEQARVDRQRREGSGLGRGRLAMLGELPWRDRPAFALALAWPTGEHLRARGLRRSDRLRR